MKQAYVTVITNERFYPGLCALKYSLEKVGSKYPLVAVVPKTLDEQTRALIQGLDLGISELDHIELSEEFKANNPAKRWNETLFKLSVFRLKEFDKVVLLDLDMVVSKNIDELFDCPDMSAVAAGRCIHEDWTRLNSGVMVVVPDENVYSGLLACLQDAYNERLAQGYGFGDQDVVNCYFRDWPSRDELHLSEIYNCMTICAKKLSSVYGFDNLKILHFAEAKKPWEFTAKLYCAWIGRRILLGEFAQLKLLSFYLKCLRKSCPNFRKYR